MSEELLVTKEEPPEKGSSEEELPSENRSYEEGLEEESVFQGKDTRGNES